MSWKGINALTRLAVCAALLLLTRLDAWFCRWCGLGEGFVQEELETVWMHVHVDRNNQLQADV